MSIAILILAAGQSTRMKTTKQLLAYRGRTLVGNAIRTAKQTQANKILVVLGADQESVRKEIKNYAVDSCFNPSYQEGMGTSIAAGVKALTDHKGILIMLADQPLINSSYLNELIQKGIETDHIVASIYNTNYGVPAFFPSKYFYQLTQLKEDKGAKNLLNNPDMQVLHVNTPVNLTDIDDRNDFQNLNTPE